MLKTVPSPDPRFDEVGPKLVSELLPANSSVIVLRGMARGSLGKVLAHNPNGTVKVRIVVVLAMQLHPGADAVTAPHCVRVCGQLSLRVRPKEPPFAATIVSSIVDPYFPANVAARALRITPRLLGMITGTVKCSPGYYDLGLNLKVFRRLYLPGYVRSTAQAARAPAWRCVSFSTRPQPCCRAVCAGVL